MDVKIDTNYSPVEIQGLLACLVTSGFLTPSDLTQQVNQLQDWAICFLDINSLLLPFRDKFVWYDKWQKDQLSYELGRAGFYASLTQRLLLACPLASLQPTCEVEVEATPEVAKAIVRTSSAEASFSYADYSEYMTRVVVALNALLAGQGFDAAYYEVGFDEGSGFLLLMAQQYDYLLTNRVVRFTKVMYPEIEAWRATIREEDLPF
jgi:hypothetical protein